MSMKQIKEIFKRKKKENNNHEFIKMLFLAICISLFSMYPYLNEKVPFGHDLGYHLNRINEIANGLNRRVLPVLIHSGLIENLGYGNGFFYPQLFLYIPAILVSKFNILVIPAYKIFLVIISFFTFIATYISVKGIFKNKHIAWIASILYIFSLYRLTDIYVRAALGEILAFAFIPLILYGFYNCLFDDNKKWWVLVIGLTGLIYSHLLSVLIMGIFFAIFVILNIDKVFKNKKVFFNLLKAAVITILLTVAYFGPMLEQKNDDVFNVDGRSIYSSEEVETFASSIGMMFSSTIKGGYATDSNINTNTFSEGVGIILMIMASLILFRKKLSYKENRFEIQLFVLGWIFYFATTKLFPWEKFSLLNVIQFPFRLNMIATLCFAVVGAKEFYSLIEGENSKQFVLVFSILFLLYTAYQLDSVEIDFTGWNGTYEVLTSTYDRQVGSAEYLPDGTYIYDYDLYNVNDKENKLEFKQDGSTITFDYYDTKNPLKINLPLVYYKGYRAYIEDDAGNITELKVEKNIENAHVLVTSDEILSGKITVKYCLTNVQKTSYIISSISFVGFLIYILIYVFKNKKKNTTIMEK